MSEARITFSNNETIIIREGDIFIPVQSIELDNETSSSMGKHCEIWSHTHDGLIPSITELLYKGQFFFNIEDKNTIYSTTSIVKVENL
ncbi:hypothetical protein SAMN05421743_12172 [Thalassobacillus cyri]|uniref:Uncharacterized protein n=1 Tax=Thalassobacillus cyri TaxID=571932 RepID=A0A1H4H2W7_9BACI|nr:hypothetical protein [Thalassobacillus cyri]SEB15981.1 hypothetical protein SAMN05421743_12172 [Thalassobacillus cyri]